MAGIRLEWTQTGHFDHFEIYRNSASTAIEDLDTPLATLVKTMYFMDSTVVEGATYFYRVKVIRGEDYLYSGEIEAVAANGDEFWTSVEVLIHGDATTYPSTNIVNKSLVPKTVTRTGNPRIVAGTGLPTSYDGGWIEFPTTGINFFSLPALAVGLADYTYEQFFVISAAPNSSNYLMFLGADGTADTVALSIDSSRNLWFEAKVAWLYYGLIVGTTPATLNVRYHVCLMRKGTRHYLFLNGVLLGSNADYPSINIPAGPMTFGNRSNGNNANSNFKGYAFGMRLTKGVARYPTTGFEPPAAKFPTSA